LNAVENIFNQIWKFGTSGILRQLSSAFRVLALSVGRQEGQLVCLLLFVFLLQMNTPKGLP